MNFHDELKLTIHRYIKLVYKVTNKFPKDEVYGATSQIKRAALSVMLNYIEGFGRRRKDDSKVYLNFLEISYGSLMESKYILFLAKDLGWITGDDYCECDLLNDKIGRMLWGVINKIRNNKNIVL